MKKTKLFLALCLAGSLAQAQIIYTIAGDGTQSTNTGNGGFAASAKLDAIDVKVDASGNVYFADGETTIRRISTTGIITVVAGTIPTGSVTGSGYSGDNGPATAAKLNQPNGICFDPSGNLYIADLFNNVIRKVTAIGGQITPSCTITTVAGTGTSGFSGDGFSATSANLHGPTSIAADASSNLYIVDAYNYRIRKVTASTGIITTVAGNGTAGYTGDGSAATAAEITPVGIIVDGSNNLYISDGTNGVIRKVTASTGNISTIAGTGYICSGLSSSDPEENLNGGYRSSDDGGAATSAELSFPQGMSFDGSGNLYIADKHNARIRKINTSGTISTFAGSGTVSYNGAATSCQVPGGFSGDEGIPTSAKLNHPSGVAFDASGNCYIADEFNSRIRKISVLCPANAGPNLTNVQPCCGGFPGVQIGNPSIPGMIYSWAPSTKLSSTTIAQPTSTWTSTTCQIYTVTVSYSLCTTNTSTVQVCAQAFHGTSCCRLAAGIETENQSSVAFTVYPNPASGQATISLYDKATYIQVVDMQGRLLFEGKEIPAGDFKLDISRYNKGVYFISAKLGNTIEKQKLIVE